jgi:hypothetical protein
MMADQEHPLDWGVVFDGAKLNAVEVSKLLNVSRVTVSLWRNNKHQPHALHKAKIVKFLELVGKAVAGGNLPFDRKGMPMEERLTRIRKALQSVA